MNGPHRLLPGFRRKPPFFVLTFCVLPLLLSACTAPSQPDLFYLRDQIKKEAPLYAFAPEALLFRNGIYYCYYSLRDEHDLLLTLKEDERGKIDRITLTALRGSAAAAEDLPAFAAILARLLIPACDLQAMEKELGLQIPAGPAPDTGETAGSPAAFYRCGKCRAALYTGRYARCFVLETRSEAQTTARYGDEGSSR